MNNTKTTTLSRTSREQETRKPAYNGLYLVSRNDRPAASPAQAASADGPKLAIGRNAGSPDLTGSPETRSAESIRMKLAACFGALLTAPIVWCLHTLLLSHQTH